MSGIVAAGLCAVALGTAGAASPPLTDIDALVTYETRQVMPSGVTRVDTWQERLVRRGPQVWIERVLAPTSGAGHAHEARAEHAGHKHFNAETATRWLTLAADGHVEMRLVDREHKAVVSVPRAEFGTVGFDGRFDAAASVVPPSVVNGLKATGPSAAEHWRVGRSDGWSHRVQWSPARQLAMRVESQREDGSLRRVVKVVRVPATGAAPWTRLADYTPKHYGDFMD